ncbi:hypothetical protein FN961_18690 [Shewanella hanedai]|uniref:Uncharacterized protein n=2 Tax=Shewanella hanedai TaxID=25 RepID=A0A553JK71_SHEHA|nr:hypothetical protein FN961_18690 [Shewanella hanedai]
MIRILSRTKRLMLALFFICTCLLTAIVFGYEWLAIKIADQYLAKYNTQITEFRIRPRSLTHWQLPKLTLKVKGSEIKIQDLELTFDKHFSPFNFSTDQLTKITLGRVDVSLSPDVLTNEGKSVDSQGPTLALDIAQLPQIDIGYTQLTLKGIPSTRLSLDLEYLRLDKQGRLTSFLSQQGEKLFALDARLNEKKWSVSSSIVFEQLQLLLTQISQQAHDSSALSILLQAKARLDELGLQFSGTLNSQADLNLKTAQLQSTHQLIDSQLVLTKLSNLVILPSTLATVPKSERERQHLPNRQLKFEIKGHIADLSLTLSPLSLQLAPDHQQQASLLSLIENGELRKVIEQVHLNNQNNNQEFDKLAVALSLNKPVIYSFQSHEINAPNAQFSFETDKLSVISSVKEFNLNVPTETNNLALNSVWSLKAETKATLNLEQLLDKNVDKSVPLFKFPLAKSSLFLQGDLKIEPIDNETDSSSAQQTAFSFNIDPQAQITSDGLTVHASQGKKPTAMNMKVKSLSLLSHSPLKASYVSGQVSMALPSLTLALGPVSYYHPQPSSKTKEIEFEVESLIFNASSPSYFTTTQRDSGDKQDLAASDFQFTGSVFSLTSSGVSFLDKQVDELLAQPNSALSDKEIALQAPLASPSLFISTQETKFASLDTILINSVHTNKSNDDNDRRLMVTLPSFTLEQTDSELTHVTKLNSKPINQRALNQEFTGQLPKLSLTIAKPTTLELNPEHGISVSTLLSQTPWENQATYHIEGLEIKRHYHKNKRLRTEKLLQLYQGTVTQTFNWNKESLLTQEQWDFDGLELNSEHKVTPDLAHTDASPLSINGKINLDTELSHVISLIESTYPLPTTLYADGHAALNARYQFTQKRVPVNKEDKASTQKVSQFIVDFTPTLSELSGSINELPFEEAMMNAKCQLSLHSSQEGETSGTKEQSTLSCPDINLSATAFNPGVLIEDFTSHASLLVSLDSEHALDSNQIEPADNVPANLSNFDIQMNADGKLLGGKLSLPEFSLKLKDRSHGYLLLQGLSLAELIAIQPQVGLHADGTFDGVLPVELVGGKVSVSGGRLAARAPGGLITLSGNPGVDQMRDSQPYLDFAFSTLEHLEYSQLSSSFDMAPSGDAILNVNVKGEAKGIERPIHLNYSQEENMLQLLKSLQIGDKLQTQIEQSMN